MTRVLTPEKDAVIFDVDGTLCDVRSIRHLVAKGSRTRNFDAFHEQSVDCPAHLHVADAARQARADGLAVLVVTARKFAWRYHTMVWLHEHQVPYDELYMRADSDGRPDYEVKTDVLRNLRADGYRPVHAWDDNPSVIALWRQQGIPVTVVPGWDDPVVAPEHEDPTTKSTSERTRS